LTCLVEVVPVQNWCVRATVRARELTANGGALTHGFQAAFYVLAGIAVFGAIVAAVLTESHARVADAEPAEEPVLAEAA
jgi:hypothetical protein